jgi:hypothetical protein
MARARAKGAAAGDSSVFSIASGKIGEALRHLGAGLAKACSGVTLRRSSTLT